VRFVTHLEKSNSTSSIKADMHKRENKMIKPIIGSLTLQTAPHGAFALGSATIARFREIPINYIGI
jgi:hypothetical protein